MDAIGGYFELELRKGEHYHKNALKLNTARNCFEYVLRARGYKKVYMPYYTCEVMFQPLNKLGVDYSLYHIDERFEIFDLPILNDGEAILYTNYFALKQSYVESLAIRYGSNLIVDNAQAFYAPRINGIDTFYSARKFFGVPDGAYLYTDCYWNEELEQDVSLERMMYLLKRIDLGAEAGYDDFRLAEKTLDYQSIKKMSKFTDAILKSIDYDSVAVKRVDNYKFLEDQLHHYNLISLDFSSGNVPMVYPYMPKGVVSRESLLNSKIFIAKYWDGIPDRHGISVFEKGIVGNLLPLIIDHRYDLVDLKRVVTTILQ